MKTALLHLKNYDMGAPSANSIETIDIIASQMALVQKILVQKHNCPQMIPNGGFLKQENVKERLYNKFGSDIDRQDYHYNKKEQLLFSNSLIAKLHRLIRSKEKPLPPNFYFVLL